MKVLFPVTTFAFVVISGFCNNAQSDASKAITSISADAQKDQIDNVKKGTVQGRICYPTDYVIPSMKLYAKDIEHNKVYSLTTKDNDTFFVLKISQKESMSFMHIPSTRKCRMLMAISSKDLVDTHMPYSVVCQLNAKIEG
jgi:hypothetical protein